MSTSPGWYPDPNNASQERWFDGQAWSDEHVRPAGGASAAPQQGGMPFPPPPAMYGGSAGVPPQSADSSGMVMGIIGIVCGLIAFGFCPIGFGIAGVVLGVLAVQRQARGVGTAAIVVSAIGLIGGIIISLVVVGNMMR